MEAGHYDSVTYLRLWSGDLQGALQLATEKGELNDHLLSIAPMGNKFASRVDPAVFLFLYFCFYLWETLCFSPCPQLALRCGAVR